MGRQSWKSKVRLDADGTSLIVSRPLGEVPLPPGSEPEMKQRAMMQLVVGLPVPQLQ
jgi:hypothetical protein